MSYETTPTPDYVTKDATTSRSKSVDYSSLVDYSEAHTSYELSLYNDSGDRNESYSFFSEEMRSSLNELLNKGYNVSGAYGKETLTTPLQIRCSLCGDPSQNGAFCMMCTQTRLVNNLPNHYSLN